MTGIQKLVIVFLGICICIVFTAALWVGAQRVQEIRAAQVAAQATAQATPLPPPTNVYPPTFTPTAPPPSPTLVLAAPRVNPSNGANLTPRPRATLDPDNPAALAIAAALKKMQDVKSMRFEMDMSMYGDLGSEIPAGFVQDGQLVLLKMTGALADKNSHITLKGMLAAMLGADPNKGVEFMTVAGKSYLRGPMQMLGVPDEQWYVSESAALSGSSTTDPDSFMAGLEEGLNLPGIAKAGVEELDGMTCEIYRADKTATLMALQDLNQTQTQFPNNMDLDTLETAETKIWVCADGYFHQLQMTLQGKSKTAPTQSMGMRIFVAIRDINSPITITPPPNPKPLKLNLSTFATPTPLAQ